MFLVNRLFGINGTSPTPELMTLDGGQLFLIRTDSIKGNSRECIFIDASIAIRRTTHEHMYQLVVTRTFQEGEDQLLEEDAENNDERSFLLDPSLSLSLYIPPSSKSASTSSFTWQDPEEDSSFSFSFPTTSSTTQIAKDFERLAWRCMWERRERRAWPTDIKESKKVEETLEDDFKVWPLQEAGGEDESHDEKVVGGKGKEPLFNPDTTEDSSEDDEEDEIAKALGAVKLSSAAPTTTPAAPSPRKSTSPPKSTKKAAPARTSRAATRSPSPPPPAPLPAPPSTPSNATLAASVPAHLFFFDASVGCFKLQKEDVNVRLFQLGGGKDIGWWLIVEEGGEVEKEGEEKETVFSISVDECRDLDFVEKETSMVFNYTSSTEPPQTWTFLLKFPSFSVLDTLRTPMTQAIFETKFGNGAWQKLKDDEREYNLAAYLREDVDMEEVSEAVGGEDERERLAREEDERKAEVEEEEAEESEEGEDVEDEESDEDEREKPVNKAKNSQLAVGYKEDLSFVVQGDMIGVFKQQRDGGKKLKFVTSIVNISTPDGKKGFTPSKVMLHNQDTSMILQNPLAPGALYRLDLETGKVVDEYKVSENFDVTSYLPDSKFAQTTQQQTFIGMSHNGLFRIDPRLAGEKLVESEFKQYATKNDFSCAATTETGLLAVASNKGDIRLFDKLGKNAKTVLPALGDPIIGLDVSADGKWVLATTKAYLLLIDTTIPDSAPRYAGASGFERSFPAAMKPTPKRMQLRPEHVAHMKGVNFTPAKFNAGLNEQEKTIVSSSGPFVIAWNFRHVKAGNVNNYTIRRFSETVIADNFKFGGDREIIVTLPGNVFVEEKKKLKAPTRDSISTIVNTWE